ncbi:hypothetical protein [Terricaulis silvestris]|uniref:Uncharacterized protein n=1 Tax=Terricaulis silvestris TaxID=2686094 RepID=A0A6I6MLD2_9CAUL|nr:hypothetical protein [Terricaulis silvestris]QGZ94058.1 hypothetical protein DSM104635_00874 [Terricaulis silvestris]
MPQAQPIITTVRVEAFIASAFRLLFWLIGVVLRRAPSDPPARLKRLLSFAECTVEYVLFLKAVALHGPPPQRKTHPRFAATGFRRVQSRRSRLFFRGAKIRARRASALVRVLALIDALTRPQRAVAYFLKQICNGLTLAHLVAVAPPAHALAASVIATADDAELDTS